jgi:Predicted transcriptional regulators containing the CopG/Arc/MetJ DNA-binding domain and a metal-binding domain
MAAISLRLPEDIEARLTQEAQLEGRPRSEVAREAIVEYLVQREKERFLAEIVAAAQALAADSMASKESLELASDLAGEGLAAITEAENAAGDPSEKWWK